MSHQPARRRHGCWTCRMRHKRCDESLPRCRECTNRHIPCYGYDLSPPDWMHDHETYERELQNIKRAIKENFRLGRIADQQRRSSRGQIVLPQPMSRQRPPLPALPAPPAPPATLSDRAPAVADPYMSIQEAYSFAYYLDYIFPLQYPYYIDRPDLGGRGWLVWLLTRSGPLRDATLTLSTLYKRHVPSSRRSENQEEKLLQHHSNALQGLRRALSVQQETGLLDHPEDWLEFVASALNLISFQIFQGGVSNWVPHLTFLETILKDLTSSTQVSQKDADSFEAVVAAKNFLLANSLWFDILACVSKGCSPQLPYREWLSLPGIDMSCVMGCQNWAMMIIGDVATVESQLGSLSSDGLQMAIDELAERVCAGLRAMDADYSEGSSAVTCSVTQVFAKSALVQISALAVQAGLTPPTTTRDAVSQVIESIRQMPPGLSLRGLVWPTCVAGSMADPDQQSFFQDLLADILKQPGSRFGNCATVLTIIKHGWGRMNGPNGECDGIWSPRRTMTDLAMCALLC